MKSIAEKPFCSSVIYAKSVSYTTDYSSSPRPWHNIAFVLEGRGTVITEESRLEIKKGDILYIPKGCEYSSEWIADPTCVYHTLHFSFPQAAEPLTDKRVNAQLLPNEDFEELYNIMKEIHHYRNSVGVDSLKFLAAFYNLVSTLLSRAITADKPAKESSITPALIYIEENFASPCKVDTLASLCCLSESRFFYLFKKQVGCSPITYKNRIAIEKAAQALVLERNAGIERIAFEYGFESPIYFRRVFKRLTGKTPSQYRREEGMI